MTDLLTPIRNDSSAAETLLPLREQAVQRLKKKRDFRAHLLAYALVNAFFWLIWGVVLAAADGPWLPWPLFPLVGWGIGLTFHAWDTYGRKPFSESDIAREAERLRKSRLR